ncbi:MAG: hypothetical protein KME30_28675 [Iphinoe sp. HA4291-MV1]|jgi:hypothetical protein|nr:hypothetical protein [Iphinoe sp. HA4291-MV1]
MANEPLNKAVDSSDRVADENYDRGITPAETAARHDREGDRFKTKPVQEGDDSLRTSDGYTVDKEGLVNNYAVEPKMYYETPGDAQQEAAGDTAQRAEELREVNEDKQGELTMEEDRRGKGPGRI